jgi:hypothetical protein
MNVFIFAFAVALILFAFVSVRDSPAAIASGEHSTGVHADALLREATVVADIRWRHMGRRGCGPRVMVYDEDAPFVVARGDQNGCQMWFSRRYRDRVWEIYNDRKASFYERADALAELCAVAVHERGHNLGLDHHDDTVMTASATYAPMTRECRYWVRYKMSQTAIGRFILSGRS